MIMIFLIWKKMNYRGINAFCSEDVLDNFHMDLLHDIQNTETKRGNNMTLEEAIQHCYESIERMKSDGTCTECISEHEQLAKWLEELNEHHMAQVGKEICYLRKCDNGFTLRTAPITSIRIGKTGSKAYTNQFQPLDIDEVLSNTRILHSSPRMILVQEPFFDAYGLKEKAQRWVDNRGWEYQEV